jgi:hypothetical protein
MHYKYIFILFLTLYSFYRSVAKLFAKEKACGDQFQPTCELRLHEDGENVSPMYSQSICNAFSIYSNAHSRYPETHSSTPFAVIGSHKRADTSISWSLKDSIAIKISSGGYLTNMTKKLRRNFVQL